MLDFLLLLAIIPFFIAVFYVINKVFSYIWDNENTKGERKEKGVVHDLRDQSGNDKYS